MSIHDRVRAKIAAGVPGHAQAAINGRLISLHPGIFGFGTTFSGQLVLTRPIERRGRLGAAQGLMIDHWVRGEAQASLGTFTRAELERRAAQHERGQGPGIKEGMRDPAFAARIRRFMAELDGAR
jgi:hypothetical protein